MQIFASRKNGAVSGARRRKRSKERGVRDKRKTDALALGFGSRIGKSTEVRDKQFQNDLQVM